MKYLNIDYQDDSELQLLFKTRAYHEATNINTRGNYQAGTSRSIIPVNWKKSQQMNYVLMKDSIRLFSMARDKSWDLVVKESNLRFRNLTKDLWYKCWRRVEEKIDEWNQVL